MKISLTDFGPADIPFKYAVAFKELFGEETITISMDTLSKMCRKIPLFWFAERFLPADVSQKYQNIMTPYSLQREDFIQSISDLDEKEQKRQYALVHEEYLSRMVIILMNLIEEHNL